MKKDIYVVVPDKKHEVMTINGQAVMFLVFEHDKDFGDFKVIKEAANKAEDFLGKCKIAKLQFIDEG